MPISGVDIYGTFLDTGTNTQSSVRANTEVEVHLSTEVDTGSKNTVVATIASHGPHRATNSPR
jgi:hypothetical protein